MVWGSTEHVLDIPSHIYTQNLLVSEKVPKILGSYGGRANCFQHLVTLIQNKILDAVDPKILISNESIKPSRGRHNNMRTSLLILDQLDIFLDRSSAVKNRRSNFRHVFTEPGILVANLEGQFSGMTKDKDRDLTVHGFDLLECRKDENGGFSKPGFCLTENIGG